MLRGGKEKGTSKINIDNQSIDEAANLLDVMKIAILRDKRRARSRKSKGTKGRRGKRASFGFRMDETNSVPLPSFADRLRFAPLPII